MNTILGFVTRGYIIEAIPMKKCSVECVKESKNAAGEGSFQPFFLGRQFLNKEILMNSKAACAGIFFNPSLQAVLNQPACLT